MKRLISLMLLALSTSPSAQLVVDQDLIGDYQRVFGANPNSIAAPGAECSGMAPGTDRSDCISGYFDASREALREIVFYLLDLLDGPAEAEFRTAQALWVKSRQHQCDALLLANPAAQGDCFSELNQARTYELQRYAALIGARR